MSATMGRGQRVVNVDQIWPNLVAGLTKIINLESVKMMPLIEDVYRLCTAHPRPYYEDLYNLFKKFIEEHADRIHEVINQSQSDLLGAYTRNWATFVIGADYCNHVFRYLNSHWINTPTASPLKGRLGAPSSTSRVPTYTIKDLCLHTWRTRVYTKLKPRLIMQALTIIEQHRNGDAVHLASVADLTRSIVHLGSVQKKQLEWYQQDLEIPFVSETESYYARESSSFIDTNGVSAYLEKAESRIHEETLRMQVLDLSSHKKLTQVVNMVLVNSHKERISNECETYLANSRISELNRVHRLLGRVDDGYSLVLQIVQKWISSAGYEKIRALSTADQNDPQKNIEALLTVHKSACDLVRNAFFDDPNFVAALDKACHQVVNETPDHNRSQAPELLARYCDTLLKKSKVNLEEAQLDESVAAVISLFKYIEEKDVFQKFYSKLLARRLILGTSVSDDAERALITGLKAECGFEYVNKLTRMLTDVTLCLDMNDVFNSYLHDNPALSLGKVDFSVMVLTAGSWPIQGQQTTFNVPEELESCLKVFNDFYHAKFQGRKLNWIHSLSKGEMKSCPKVLKRPYEFQLSVFQMAVLLMFNLSDTTTAESIATAVGLPADDLERTVLSLVESKIIIKKPPTKSLAPTDELRVNLSFASKRLKIKVISSVKTEKADDSPSTYKGVEEDRKMYLQAAIVRIMKARKELKHVQLVQEVINQAKGRFQPSVPVIKKCIEGLIEKEFLRRHDNESDRYSYVA
ncbi:cullin B [Pelomyxa schiedti]|nr:cullin B [Pelomyxa schiedti]